jgi:hypothetical protein
MLESDLQTELTSRKKILVQAESPREEGNNSGLADGTFRVGLKPSHPALIRSCRVRVQLHELACNVCSLPYERLWRFVYREQNSESFLA